MRRPARLATAPTWLASYGGNHVVKGYARWYGVDLLCAINELLLLGQPVPGEYEAQLRTMYARRTEAHCVASSAAQAEASAIKDADFVDRDGFDGGDVADCDGPGGDDIPF